MKLPSDKNLYFVNMIKRAPASRLFFGLKGWNMTKNRVNRVLNHLKRDNHGWKGINQRAKRGIKGTRYAIESTDDLNDFQIIHRVNV